MESLFEYRNPLFGVVVLLIIVAIISFANYYLIVYKKKKEQMKLSALINSFDFSSDSVDYATLIDNYNVPFEILELIANTYYKRGDYEKAIGIYLKLLDIVYDRAKKEIILESLGITYFKAGFMQRAREIFLRTLEIYPRNIKALHYLLIIYERLGEYKKAIEVIEPLDELTNDTTKLKSYLYVMSIINDSYYDFDKKCSMLLDRLGNDKNIDRLVLEFLSKIDIKLFWENLIKYYNKNLIDIVWFMNKNIYNFEYIDKNSAIKEILVAKGEIKDIDIKSDIFELQLLIDLEKVDNSSATISFEYICTECKHIFPLYQNRCPNCQSILSLDTEPIIEKKVTSEKRESLL
jgi:tetratricopeptide (TPR) repeat protein